MASFNDLINASFENKQDLEDYLTDFFDKSNLDDYQIDDLANDKQKEAIAKMFGNDDIFLRADSVLFENNFCLEAFYVYYCLSDDLAISFYFNSMFSKLINYDSLDSYEKKAIKIILEYYAMFLNDIHNITGAIDVLESLESIINDGSFYNDRLAILFSEIEELDKFYNLYLKDGFLTIGSYILLIIVCLKHNDEIKAKGVFTNLLDDHPICQYIDHVWDLDNDDGEEAKMLKNALDFCYPSIYSLPYFFSWCEQNKETSLKS